MCRIGKTFGPINFGRKSRAQSDCVAAGSVPPPGPKSSCVNSAVFVPSAQPVPSTWPEIILHEFPRFVPYQEPRADCNSVGTARQCDHRICYSVSTAYKPSAAAPQSRCSRPAAPLQPFCSRRSPPSAALRRPGWAVGMLRGYG